MEYRNRYQYTRTNKILLDKFISYTWMRYIDSAFNEHFTLTTNRTRNKNISDPVTAIETGNDILIWFLYIYSRWKLFKIMLK